MLLPIRTSRIAQQKSKTWLSIENGNAALSFELASLLTFANTQALNSNINIHSIMSLLCHQKRTVIVAVTKHHARSTECASGKIGSVMVYQTAATVATKTIAVRRYCSPWQHYSASPIHVPVSQKQLQRALSSLSWFFHRLPCSFGLWHCFPQSWSHCFKLKNDCR